MLRFLVIGFIESFYYVYWDCFVIELIFLFFLEIFVFDRDILRFSLFENKCLDKFGMVFRFVFWCGEEKGLDIEDDFK